MKLKNIIDELDKIIIDKEFNLKLSNIYNVDIPVSPLQILCLSKETIFYDDFELLRKLSFNEVLNASSDMQVDFATEKIIPIFDVGDNDYISFDISTGKWCKYNIVDSLKFDIKDKVKSYFME